MFIEPKQIASKKKIGHLKGAPVWLISTIGGLHMVISTKGGKFETLGLGPHKSLSMHVAQKKEPDIVFTDLNKADYVDPAHFASILPDYEAATDRLRELQAKTK